VDDIRIGHGIDVHPFTEGRRCILGGVEIPHARGLAGHSDADALCHAITDAVLGATGRRDIGSLFSPEDYRWKDANSLELLRSAFAPIYEEGWRVVNLDSMVLAETPKLMPYIEEMRVKIATVLQVETTRVMIKASTTEKLGFIGRSEGILASAVVLLKRLT
jgi:2-C-methyl-D-erythritol 2,4-cyclodiphosphate synthase